MTASHVSCTTSSAEAWVATKVRARSSIDADQSLSSCSKTASSPERTPATSASSLPEVTTDGGYRHSSVLGIGEVDATSRLPGRALVAVRRHPAGVLEQPGEVQQVPRHERRVPVREVVVRPTRSRVEVRRAGAGGTDPAGVGLWWDRVADVLQGVEHVLGAVLDAVLVAGDQAATDPAVVEVLAAVVEQVRPAVEPLVHLLHDRAVVAEPDRSDE